MGYVSQRRGRIKVVAPEPYRRTRAKAAQLAMRAELSRRDRIRCWEIAHRPGDLSCLDAWAVNTIAARAGGRP